MFRRPGASDLRGAGACGVGGEGTGACSGDLLLGALAACAQITCQMVAEAMGLAIKDIEVTVEGDLDLRGTLGSTARRRSASPTSGVVMQTLVNQPAIATAWA